MQLLTLRQEVWEIINNTVKVLGNTQQSVKGNLGSQVEKKHYSTEAVLTIYCLFTSV